jgi:hypothetical protein
VPGVHAVFAASGDSSFSGFKQGDPDYERAINIVHDAAIKAGKNSAARSRGKTASFTCFRRKARSCKSSAVRGQTRNLANTQAKPRLDHAHPSEQRVRAGRMI